MDKIISAVNKTLIERDIDHSIALTAPATANIGGSFAVTAVLTPAASGDTIQFSSDNPAVVQFAPTSVATNVSGSSKSIATITAPPAIPLNGIDVTVTATDGTVSDIQIIHIGGSTPATFGIFPASLDISDTPNGVPATKKVQIVPWPASESYSVASRAPFIVDATGPGLDGKVSITPSATNNAGGIVLPSLHTGTVLIEIKKNADGSTLYYPVTYSLYW
jgi:hypothetical protein